MTVTPTMRTAAVAAVIGALALVAVGELQLGPGAPQGHFTVYLDGGAPLNCAVVEADVLITPPGFAALGVDSGAAYGFARIEVSADDGGGAPRNVGDVLAAGAFVVPEVFADAQPCADGGPQIEVWLQGRPDAPMRCACAIPDGGALALLDDGGAGPAPLGVTLTRGAWLPDAGGVLPKVCTEMAGVSSWPAACGGTP